MNLDHERYVIMFKKEEGLGLAFVDIWQWCSGDVQEEFPHCTIQRMLG